MKTVPDVNERRALAFAVDRRSLVENVTKGGEEPATSFTPKGMPGFDVIAQEFLPTTADLAQARTYLEQASSPKLKLNLLYVSDDPVGEELAVATQAMWKELGIETTLRGMEFQQFLEQLGPPLHSSVDVFAIGWVGDYVDDINFLELFTCKSGNNPTGYCEQTYDKLIEQARSTPDDPKRHDLYAKSGSDAHWPRRRAAAHPDALGDVQHDAEAGNRRLGAEPARPVQLHQGLADRRLVQK